MIKRRLERTIKEWARILRHQELGYIYYSAIYARKILKSSPVICDTEGQFELHTLVCRRDFLNALWALKTFYHFCEIRPKLVIYDDGSLSESAIGIFSEHFINCHIVRRRIFHLDMEQFLKGYKTSLEYSRMASFYCALKLFGPMYYTKSEYVLYLDSDILFFRKPHQMMTYIENGTSFFMSDYQDAYSYPVKFLNELMKIDLAHEINAGLFYIARKNYLGNMDIVESYFSKISKFRDKPSKVNRHEQTLSAILLSKAGAVKLSSDYQISKTPVTDKTISHHFVDDGSRPDFYSIGLKRLKSARFIEEFGPRE